MNKRAKTPKTHDDSGQTLLAASDHVALATADADAAVAAAEAERDLARLQARQLQLELFRLEAEKTLAEARKKAADTRSARRKLADELASRYAIDWKTHALEPLTGALVPLEQQREHTDGQP